VQPTDAEAPRSGRWGRWGTWLAIVAITLTVGPFLIVLPLTYPPRPDVDFPSYHEAGRRLLAGEIARLYDSDFKEFQNLPLVTLALAPLGALPYDSAWHVMWWVNLASILGGLAVLLAAMRTTFAPLGARHAMLAAAVYFAFAPIMHRSLVLGQTTPVMVLLLAVFYALECRGRSWLAGGVLGAIALVKIPPLAIVGVFLVRRRLAIVAAASIVIGGGVLLSLALFGLGLNAAYFEKVILTNAGKGLAAFNNQSLLGSLLRLLTDRGLTDWRLEIPPAAVSLTYRVAVAALLAAVLWSCRRLVWRRKERPERGTLEAELGLGIGLMLLIFPISWVHYFQFLVVPATLLPWWWMRERLPLDRLALALLISGLALAAGAPVRGAPYYAKHDSESWFRVLQCYRTLGALLLTAGYARALALHARGNLGRGKVPPAAPAHVAARLPTSDGG
jgi:hypothetical protein